jgi:hypothetical protein
MVGNIAWQGTTVLCSSCGKAVWAVYAQSQKNTWSTNKEVDLKFASQQVHCPEGISIKIHSLVQWASTQPKSEIVLHKKKSFL